MGCDIHFYVEVRKNGKWKQAGQMVKNEWYTPGEEEGHGNTPMRHEEFYYGRNYDLFGVLAGVRSNWCPPIKKRRGLPSDISEEVSRLAADWDGDGHSHSWLNLKEILEWAYNGDFSHKGKNRFNEISDEFADVTMPKLLKLASDPKLKPEDVRIVFWFDN